jgi:hypothetical protein
MVVLHKKPYVGILLQLSLRIILELLVQNFEIPD